MFGGVTEWMQLYRCPLRPLGGREDDCRVICLDKSDSRLALCKRYFRNIEMRHGMSSVCWSDLLLRRVRFVSFPSKRGLKTREDRLKRLVAKFLMLGVGKMLVVRNFQEVLFFIRGKRILFASTEPVKDLYQFHNRAFDCYVLKDEISILRLLPAVLISRLRRSIVIDNECGVTVFTNTPNEWIIRAYRACHPNKRIILRFHDRLERISAQSKTKDRVLTLVDRLRRDGVIDSVESYSRRDAEALGASYRPNAVDPDRLADIQNDFRQCLCFFRGAPGEGTRIDHRITAIETLRNLLLRAYPGSDRWLETDIVPVGADWLAYPQYLRTAAQSEIAVDLYRVDPEEGFSFRLPEALWLGKKVVTDRTNVLKESFYDESRFFILGRDDPKRFPEFLATKFKPLSSEQLLQFDATHCWSE